MTKRKTSRTSRSKRATRTKMLGDEQLTEALENISERARSEHVPVALIGGAAMQHYGSDRLTRDIDILAEPGVTLGLPRGKALSIGGRATKLPNGVPVDLVIRNDELELLYLNALDARVRLPDLPIPIVRPDFLAAMKLAAGRPKDELDLVQLVLLLPTQRKAMRVTIMKYLGLYAGQAFDQLVLEADWRKKTGQL